MHHDDGTPTRRRPSGVAEEDEYSCCGDRHLSVSCPCIDHFDQTPPPEPMMTASGGGGGGGGDCGRHRMDTLQAPVRASGFPRVNSAPVTPMAADCIDMTAVSLLPSAAAAAADDDVNEPLLRIRADGGITFV